MSNIKNPIDTTSKVHTYLLTLIKDLKNEKFSVSDKIDIGALLDDISKKAKDYVDGLKKELPLSTAKSELEGSIARASYSERANIEIPAKEYHKQVGTEKFLDSVKISITKVREYLPENVINEIAIINEPTKQVSFKILQK